MDLYNEGREESTAKGREVYKKIKHELESAHAGELVAIHPDSGEYFIGKTLGEADCQAYAKHPNAWFYFVRVGDENAAMSLRTW